MRVKLNYFCMTHQWSYCVVYWPTIFILLFPGKLRSKTNINLSSSVLCDCSVLFDVRHSFFFLPKLSQFWFCRFRAQSFSRGTCKLEIAAAIVIHYARGWHISGGGACQWGVACQWGGSISRGLLTLVLTWLIASRGVTSMVGVKHRSCHSWSTVCSNITSHLFER